MMTNWFLDRSLLRALRGRSFALLWGGQTLSRIGDFLYQIVLAWWVLQETSSATMMATVFIVAYTPTILFGLIGGVAVDRYPRLRIMLAADLLRGLVVGGARCWSGGAAFRSGMSTA
ncbi:MAG: MFS transporter [Caldilineaceae bacterium]